MVWSAVVKSHYVFVVSHQLGWALPERLIIVFPGLTGTRQKPADFLAIETMAIARNLH